MYDRAKMYRIKTLIVLYRFLILLLILSPLYVFLNTNIDPSSSLLSKYQYHLTNSLLYSSGMLSL